MLGIEEEDWLRRWLPPDPEWVVPPTRSLFVVALSIMTPISVAAAILFAVALALRLLT
jgi:hypothetical protein